MAGWGRRWGLGFLLLCTGCVSTKPQQRMINSVEPSAAAPAKGQKYIDRDFGFELTPPEGNWQLDANHATTPEGVAVPVVLRNRDTGEQVVVQVAPSVATPASFAERLSTGLKRQPGFTAYEPELFEVPANSVGFRFELGDLVRGKVAVFEPHEGQVFMFLATWPASLGDEATGVEEIMKSLKALPRS